MDNLFAFFILISVPLFFGVRYTFEFCEPFSRKNWKLHNLFAATTFLGYLVLFFFLGKQGLYELRGDSGGSKEFEVFFVLPSLGFGLAIFPKVAAQYLENHLELVQAKITGIVVIPGWIIIFNLASIIFDPF